MVFLQFFLEKQQWFFADDVIRLWMPEWDDHEDYLYPSIFYKLFFIDDDTDWATNSNNLNSS